MSAKTTWKESCATNARADFTVSVTPMPTAANLATASSPVHFLPLATCPRGSVTANQGSKVRSFLSPCGAVSDAGRNFSQEAKS